MPGVSPIIRPWANYWGKPCIRLLASYKHCLGHGAAMKGQDIIVLNIVALNENVVYMIK